MKNLIVLDLVSLGSAYAIINRFVDSENIEVFEVSPIGTGSLLILNTNDMISGQIVFNNIQSEFKTEILSRSFVEDIETSVIKSYLSQFQATIKKNMCIIESTHVSKIFSVADKAAKIATIDLVDFRVIRTNPCNAFLVITSDNILDLLSLKESEVKITMINDVQMSVKQYFEIVKS